MIPRYLIENKGKRLPTQGGGDVHRKGRPHERESLVLGHDVALKLRVFCCGEYLFEARPRMVPGSDQVLARNQQLRPDLLFRNCLISPFRIVIERQIFVTRKAVDTMQLKMLRKARQPKEPLECRPLHALHISKPHVIFYEG